LLDRICGLCSVGIPIENRTLTFQDQAGFAWGLQYAWNELSRGNLERCVVGGVDACTDAEYLAAAHHFHVVKTEDQPAGFQPGEAAAFLLVETAEVALKGGSRVLGWIDAAAVGEEQVKRCSRKPALGIGLADTIDACLGCLPEVGGLGWTIADLNGDAFRGNDWGYALTRLAARDRRVGAFPMTIPAESFGEIGAAHGAVASCMAIRAFERGYAPASQALVCLASYDGGRGAFVIRSGA
jgi:3-oxoacyl-(acyl-carrier-protein) synthase